MTSSITHRLDAVVDGALAAERIVGTVVLLSRHGETVYARAAGFADREEGRPMREDAIFRLASITKLFTATAALALVERGVLDLDRPVTNWLPDFAPRLEGRPVPITLRQLLSHSAGLSYGFLEPEDGQLHRAGVSDGMDVTPLTLAENIRRIAGAPLLFAPGTGFAYSLGIDVAGAVIEAATGRTLPEVMHDLVTGPLGLSDAGFALTDPARLASAYADDNPRPRRMREPDTLPFVPGMAGVVMDPSRAFRPDAFPSGGAGMVGTAGAVLALLEALASGAAPLLSPDLVAEMGRDQIEGIAIEGSPGWGYGLGFSVLRDGISAGVPESRGAWRWGGAYGHSWVVDRDRGMILVAFTNTAFEGMWNGGRFPADLGRALSAAS